MSQTNMIPAPWAAGQFEAVIPFDNVVDAGTYYTVEAIRTIPEMQGSNLDIYTKVLQPAGIPKDDTTKYIDELINAKAVIIALTSSDKAPIYVPSTYLATFPAIDGVVYEHLCLVADLGACPPGLKDLIQEMLVYIREYISSHIGVDAEVQVGTIPTKGYVSKQQAEIWENARKIKIASSQSLIIENEKLKADAIAREAYVKKLEAALKAK